MAEIQELINRIKNEGVQTAEENAKRIEGEAHAKASAIIAAAQEGADELRSAAKEDIKRTQESTQKSLEQASRDMLLALRQKIEQMLKSIIDQDVKSAMSSEQLAIILADVISKTANGDASIEVTLSEKDSKALKDGALAKLQKTVKGNLKLQTSDDVTGGFMISYDAGKSSYDFSDESLANYLSTFVNDQVATILKESVG